MRKTVTAVFVDLEDSTGLGERLDAEPLDHVMDRYYTLARRVFEGHGGSLQEFAGDGARVLFGVEVLREDDALRAVSAAVEFRDALTALNDELDRDWGVRLRARTGVNTGEAAVDPRARDALGDFVNVAARLEKQAAPGEILIGSLTYQLVRQAVTAEELTPLRVRGRRRPVQTWRLLGVDPHARDRARPATAPMVGRKVELDLLRSFFRRMVAERRCHRLTVYGEAGVGKTRLVSELELLLKGEATVLRGRCLPYGPDVTYRPLAQILRQAAGIQLSDPPDLARQRLEALAGGDERVAGHVAQILGLRGGSGTPEDAHWALGRALTLMAEQRPLIVVIDDLHWAQPTLLDFIRHVTDRSGDAQLLLVCVARPDLSESHGGWADESRNTMVLTLSPLREEQTKELIGRLLGRGTLAPELQRELVIASAGIPLFAEELVSVLVEEQRLRLEGDQWVAAADLSQLPVPLSTRTLLDARLEQLEPDERVVLQRAAVVGVEFRTAEVAALSPVDQRAAIADRLLALEDKGLVSSDPATSEDGFRFRHVLIRDATYRSITKEGRAELHERYADWLERAADSRGQLDAIAGHHLEQAYNYRVELRRMGEETRAVGRRAGERLAAAGHREMVGGDRPKSAAGLLRRAIKLLDEQDALYRETLLDLAAALSDASDSQADSEEVVRTYEQALAAATEAGDDGRAMHARLGWLEVRAFDEVGELLQKGRQVAERALRVFEAPSDDDPDPATAWLGLAKAWRLLAYVNAAVGRSSDAQEAAEHAIRLTQRAKDERLEARNRRIHCFVLEWGPTPIPNVISSCEETRAWATVRGMRTLEQDVRNIMAKAHAALGEFDRAREHLDAARPSRAHRPSGDRGERLFWVAHELAVASVELLAGNFAEAERVLVEALELTGKGTRPNVTAMLARSLLLQNRNDEALGMARECEDSAAEQQLDPQLKWRELQAVALARQGDLKAADSLIREAVVLSERSEQLDSKAQVHGDLAEVLRLAGRQTEAADALRFALRLYRDKGDLVSARRIERLLEEP